MLGIGRWPYALALTAVRALTSAEVWPRNSYLTKAFRPGMSDLDLTLWFNEEPDPLEVELLARRLNAMKLGLPFLGEIQVYVGAWVERFAPCANRYELMRDPRTHRRLHASPLVPADVEKTVFILRMLDADSKNLLRRPRAREAKWKGHFKSTGLSWNAAEFGDDPLALILNRILEPAAAAAAKHYLRERHSKPEHEFAANPWLFALFPHRFCHAHGKPESLALPEITLAQIAWEIWGLSSQVVLSQNPASIREHLEKLNLLSLQAWKLAPEHAVQFAEVGEKIDALKSLVSFHSSAKTSARPDQDTIRKSGTDRRTPARNAPDSDESEGPTP